MPTVGSIRPVENLGDRFEISATAWAQAIDPLELAYPIPKGSLDAHAFEGLSNDNEGDAIARAGVRLLAGQAITGTWLEVHDLRANCESPIEITMALALMVGARHENVSVKFVSVRIEPQAQLGEHRVDFCLTLDGSIRSKDGRIRSGSRQMVIECDGHDFHERTKEQARRDRERDRLLQSFGFVVYRYTGQEIWQDVFACAKQAFDDLEVSVRSKLSDRPPIPG